MHIEVITLFPALVESVVGHGVTARAARAGVFDLTCRNPRDWAVDARGTVDDRPFGGGPGMVMRPEPLSGAIAAARAAAPAGSRVIGLTPQGRPLDQRAMAAFARAPGLVLLAGRYEGIDERVLAGMVDEEWSLGDYVLSGGELAAMVVIDGVARLLPGGLGDAASASADSFSDGLLEGPQYTRPAAFDGRTVPAVLLCGDHATVARWRRREALGRTWLRRPDLLERSELAREDRELLEEFMAEYRQAVLDGRE